MNITLKILTFLTIIFSQNLLFTSQIKHTLINPDQIIKRGINFTQDGRHKTKQCSPRELHHYATHNQGISIFAVVPKKESNEYLVSPLGIYEPTDFLDTQNASYFASYGNQDSSDIDFYDVTYNIAPLINQLQIEPRILGSALFNGNQQALIDAHFIQPAALPTPYVPIINTEMIIAEVQQRTFFTFSQHIHLMTQAAFNAGVAQGQILSQNSTSILEGQSKLTMQDTDQVEYQEQEESSTTTPIKQETSTVDAKTDSKKEEQETTSTLDSNTKELRKAAKKERIRLEKQEKRKIKTINYATEKAKTIYEAGIKIVLDEIKKKYLSEKLSISTSIEKIEEFSSKKTKRKKKKKSEANQLLENEDEDEQLLDTKLSDKELIKIMPMIDEYYSIVRKAHISKTISQDDLKIFFHNACIFFDTACHSKNDFFINFLNTTFASTLNFHAAMVNPENPLVIYSFSAGILYGLNLLYRLERESKTISYEDASVLLRKTLHHLYLRNIVDYYIKENSDLLEQKIKTNFDKRTLIPKKHDLFHAEEQYIKKYELEIGKISLYYVPHIIENILPYLIDILTKTLRGVKDYETQSNCVDECIELTIILINYIKIINPTSASRLETKLKTLLEEKNILSLLNDDEDYPYIANLLQIKTDTELFKKPDITPFLIYKYYERKKSGKFIYETLNHLKDGIYGNPIELLKDQETQFAVYALLQLPEMKCSKLTLYKEFKKLHPGLFEKIIEKSEDTFKKYNKFNQIS